MLKIIAIQWGLHDGDLRNALFKRTDLDVIKYKDLVKLSFEVVYNNDFPFEDYVADVERIHEIDDGDYQGTLLYLIPFGRYQPEEYEYLMTYVGYGSCSGCDALQSIQCGSPDRKTMVNDLMTLCKDILANTIKPFNGGWRKTNLFENTEKGE